VGYSRSFVREIIKVEKLKIKRDSLERCHKFKIKAPQSTPSNDDLALDAGIKNNPKYQRIKSRKL